MKLSPGVGVGLPHSLCASCTQPRPANVAARISWFIFLVILALSWSNVSTASSPSLVSPVDNATDHDLEETALGGHPLIEIPDTKSNGQLSSESARRELRLVISYDHSPTCSHLRLHLYRTSSTMPRIGRSAAKWSRSNSSQRNCGSLQLRCWLRTYWTKAGYLLITQ